MTARQNIAEGLITVKGWKKDQALEKAQQILDDIGLGDKGINTLLPYPVDSNNGSVLAALWRSNQNCCSSMNQLQHSILSGLVKYLTL
ncbi:ABC-type polar amino acid transport system ATPase component [Vibrio variabilis]|uniref:ABC-type polar amino acid transport system ATPase component n=1 Tax=Vibrio variabilis TaxID=990271 RepID=A0ABQ0JEX8_9VIBR|nr:ABC-type polar amino acid transport system ATPase component [Vibrio variabilis]